MYSRSNKVNFITPLLILPSSIGLDTPKLFHMRTGEPEQPALPTVSGATKGPVSIIPGQTKAAHVWGQARLKAHKSQPDSICGPGGDGTAPCLWDWSQWHGSGSSKALRKPCPGSWGAGLPGGLLGHPLFSSAPKNMSYFLKLCLHTGRHHFFYTMKLPPHLCTLTFVMRLLPPLLLISIRMSCPISCLFLTSRALLPSLFVSLLSAQCCWLGSLGRALTTLPSSLIASTLRLSSNSRSHLSLPQSFSSFLKSSMS